jgi:hypothetical protein
MNTVRQNRDLFLTVRTGWDLGSDFYTDPKFMKLYKCNRLRKDKKITLYRLGLDI